MRRWVRMTGDRLTAALAALIGALLRLLQRRLGHTIICFGQDLSAAVKVGSEIAVMAGGGIVQIGTPREIVLEPAAGCIADFLGHVNRLSVLRAAEVMTPLERLAETPEGRLFDRVGMLVLGNAGLRGPGGAVDLVRLAEAPPRSGAVTVAAPETPLRRLIEARLVSGMPVLIAADGAFVGIVGDRELYGGLVAR